ncbi:GspE/PulE family protein [uncultured Odoribacter sp.]|uniref:GspE/PulE family protein n=1 Tax=uncultured Odoribacter sp. TaxID=876416 RepID=UPI00260DC923|nr:GspE/PulE family protein [uncultured Odoribacter sp.]
MDELRIPVEVIGFFTPEEARVYGLLPFEKREEKLDCYGEKGRNYEAVVQEIEIIRGVKVGIEYLPPEEFRRLIRQYYREGVADSGKRTQTAVSAGEERDFLSRLIEEAYRTYASDIHFEAYEERCRVRFRIDGRLLERYGIDKENYAALVNQVKILANLDISEKRLPQDGRIFFHRGDCKFDVRVSCLPAIHGEKIVLRLLTRHAELLELGNLGFSGRQLNDYREAVSKPHGLVLISGPTGSGKSTTLYATLRLLNREDNNILTIEDPVEYTLEGVNQVQLKEEIGLTFGSALRTFLRQDPDIIMLGEIRDTETARMAVRSSLTGHLIFSTIHTNSAWGCVARLADMGLHPYLISDTLLLCMAQRLVRVLCPHCKRETEEQFPLNIPWKGEGKPARFYRAEGCEACYYTGYSGRKAIYEVIPIDSRLSAAVRNQEADISALLKERGIQTLRETAIGLLREGLTSPEEILPLLNES